MQTAYEPGYLVKHLVGRLLRIVERVKTPFWELAMHDLCDIVLMPT